MLGGCFALGGFLKRGWKMLKNKILIWKMKYDLKNKSKNEMVNSESIPVGFKFEFKLVAWNYIDVRLNKKLKMLG